MPKKHKTCSSWKVDFKNNWKDMTLTPVFTTWDLSGIWILSGQGGKPQKLKRTFLCLVLHAQWNLCSTLQTEPPLCNTVQVAETVAEGHFGKHFNSRMPDAPLLKLTHLNSYSHTSTAWAATPSLSIRVAFCEVCHKVRPSLWTGIQKMCCPALPVCSLLSRPL